MSAGATARDHNPQKRQQQFYELQADMQKRAAGAVKKMTKDIDVQADEKTKIRIAQPATEYDDKGAPKKLDKAALKALKGPDASLPGYTAEMDALKPGQVVTLYLAKPKAKPKEKAKDKDALDDDKPAIKMIVIVQDVKDS